ncbi:actinodefensin-associated protein B [Streptomyces sp. NPDC002994]|uniref:actinodefensin-associated protein B n=1 Tax=Streptomyces sp. NPDC002994 TaxID=3154441 RepID=UPI0033AFFA20
MPALLRLAPDVTLTRLPYGGSVLLNAVTLALAECGEPQAFVIDRLLATGLSIADRGSPPAYLAAELVAHGWLTVCPSPLCTSTVSPTAEQEG